MDDDRGRLVGDPALDGALEVAAGDVEGAGDGALLVLLRLPHVEQHGAGHLPGRIRRGGVDLADLGLGGRQELTEAGHRTVLLSHRRLKTLPGEVNYRTTGRIPAVAPEPVQHRAALDLGDLVGLDLVGAVARGTGPSIELKVHPPSAGS